MQSNLDFKVSNERSGPHKLLIRHIWPPETWIAIILSIFNFNSDWGSPLCPGPELAIKAPFHEHESDFGLDRGWSSCIEKFFQKSQSLFVIFANCGQRKKTFLQKCWKMTILHWQAEEACLINSLWKGMIENLFFATFRNKLWYRKSTQSIEWDIKSTFLNDEKSTRWERISHLWKF